MFIKKLLEKIMAKKKKEFLQEIAPEGEEETDEIAEEVANNEEPELLVEQEEDDGEQDAPKMSKGEFLDSIGLGDRPGSQLAITKWEEYLGT